MISGVGSLAVGGVKRDICCHLTFVLVLVFRAGFPVWGDDSPLPSLLDTGVLSCSSTGASAVAFCLPLADRVRTTGGSGVDEGC